MPVGSSLREYEEQMAERMATTFWDLVQDLGFDDEDGLLALEQADAWVSEAKRAVNSRN